MKLPLEEGIDFIPNVTVTEKQNITISDINYLKDYKEHCENVLNDGLTGRCLVSHDVLKQAFKRELELTTNFIKEYENI